MMGIVLIVLIREEDVVFLLCPYDVVFHAQGVRTYAHPI